MRKSGYPLEEVKSNEAILCELEKNCLDKYALGEEPEHRKRARQMVILSVLADDEELGRNLAVGTGISSKLCSSCANLSITTWNYWPQVRL